LDKSSISIIFLGYLTFFIKIFMEKLLIFLFGRSMKRREANCLKTYNSKPYLMRYSSFLFGKLRLKGRIDRLGAYQTVLFTAKSRKKATLSSLRVRTTWLLVSLSHPLASFSLLGAWMTRLLGKKGLL
jgi:hypothetical protein